MRDFEIIVHGQTIRLCVDLNIWVRYLLGRRAGRVGPSAANAIVEAVQRGRSPAGPIQLIVSYTMLARLEDVLVRLSFQPGDASAFCSLMGAFARRGPSGIPPHMVLGGGTSPTAESRMLTYNPYDPKVVPPRADDEDGRVLDTAVAGQAHIIATFNFADFRSPNSQVLEAGRAQLYQAAHHNVLILHANKAAECLASGDFSWPIVGP